MRALKPGVAPILATLLLSSHAAALPRQRPRWPNDSASNDPYYPNTSSPANTIMPSGTGVAYLPTGSGLVTAPVVTARNTATASAFTTTVPMIVQVSTSVELATSTTVLSMTETLLAVETSTAVVLEAIPLTISTSSPLVGGVGTVTLWEKETVVSTATTTGTTTTTTTEDLSAPSPSSSSSPSKSEVALTTTISAVSKTLPPPAATSSEDDESPTDTVERRGLDTNKNPRRASADGVYEYVPAGANDTDTHLAARGLIHHIEHCAVVIPQTNLPSDASVNEACRAIKKMVKDKKGKLHKEDYCGGNTIGGLVYMFEAKSKDTPHVIESLTGAYQKLNFTACEMQPADMKLKRDAHSYDNAHKFKEAKPSKSRGRSGAVPVPRAMLKDRASISEGKKRCAAVIPITQLPNEDLQTSDKMCKIIEKAVKKGAKKPDGKVQCFSNHVRADQATGTVKAGMVYWFEEKERHVQKIVDVLGESWNGTWFGACGVQPSVRNGTKGGEGKVEELVGLIERRSGGSGEVLGETEIGVQPMNREALSRRKETKVKVFSFIANIPASNFLEEKKTMTLCMYLHDNIMKHTTLPDDEDCKRADDGGLVYNFSAKVKHATEIKAEITADYPDTAWIDTTSWGTKVRREERGEDDEIIGHLDLPAKSPSEVEARIPRSHLEARKDSKEQVDDCEVDIPATNFEHPHHKHEQCHLVKQSITKSRGGNDGMSIVPLHHSCTEAEDGGIKFKFKSKHKNTWDYLNQITTVFPQATTNNCAGGQRKRSTAPAYEEQTWGSATALDRTLAAREDTLGDCSIIIGYHGDGPQQNLVSSCENITQALLPFSSLMGWPLCVNDDRPGHFRLRFSAYQQQGQSVVDAVAAAVPYPVDFSNCPWKPSTHPKVATRGNLAGGGRYSLLNPPTSSSSELKARDPSPHLEARHEHCFVKISGSSFKSPIERRRCDEVKQAIKDGGAKVPRHYKCYVDQLGLVVFTFSKSNQLAGNITQAILNKIEGVVDHECGKDNLRRADEVAGRHVKESDLHHGLDMHKYPARHRHDDSWKDKPDTMSCYLTRRFYPSGHPPQGTDPPGWVNYTTTIGKLWNNGAGCTNITLGLGEAVSSVMKASEPIDVFRDLTCEDDEKYGTLLKFKTVFFTNVTLAVDQELGRLYPSVVGGFNCSASLLGTNADIPENPVVSTVGRRNALGPYARSAMTSDASKRRRVWRSPTDTDTAKPSKHAFKNLRRDVAQQASPRSPEIGIVIPSKELIQRHKKPKDTPNSQSCSVEPWSQSITPATAGGVAALSYFNFTITIGVDFAKGKGCDDVKNALQNTLKDGRSKYAPNSGFATYECDDDKSGGTSLRFTTLAWPGVTWKVDQTLGIEYPMVQERGFTCTDHSPLSEDENFVPGPNTQSCWVSIMDPYMWWFHVSIGKPWNNGAGCKNVLGALRKDVPAFPLRSFNCTSDDGDTNMTKLTFPTTADSRAVDQVNGALAKVYQISGGFNCDIPKPLRRLKKREVSQEPHQQRPPRDLSSAAQQTSTPCQIGSKTVENPPICHRGAQRRRRSDMSESSIDRHTVAINHTAISGDREGVPNRLDFSRPTLDTDTTQPWCKTGREVSSRRVTGFTYAVFVPQPWNLSKCGSVATRLSSYPNHGLLDFKCGRYGEQNDIMISVAQITIGNYSVINEAIAMSTMNVDPGCLDAKDVSVPQHEHDTQRTVVRVVTDTPQRKRELAMHTQSCKQAQWLGTPQQQWNYTILVGEPYNHGDGCSDIINGLQSGLQGALRSVTCNPSPDDDTILEVETTHDTKASPKLNAVLTQKYNAVAGGFDCYTDSPGDKRAVERDAVLPPLARPDNDHASEGAPISPPGIRRDVHFLPRTAVVDDSSFSAHASTMTKRATPQFRRDAAPIRNTIPVNNTIECEFNYMQGQQDQNTPVRVWYHVGKPYEADGCRNILTAFKKAVHGPIQRYVCVPMKTMGSVAYDTGTFISFLTYWQEGFVSVMNGVTDAEYSTAVVAPGRACQDPPAYKQRRSDEAAVQEELEVTNAVRRELMGAGEHDTSPSATAQSNQNINKDRRQLAPLKRSGIHTSGIDPNTQFCYPSSPQNADGTKDFSRIVYSVVIGKDFENGSSCTPVQQALSRELGGDFYSDTFRCAPINGDPVYPPTYPHLGFETANSTKALDSANVAINSIYGLGANACWLHHA
ncbi:hypothetical protein LTR86_003711 [Recurvomyces mirabilis]|nr:hypothetical protein LTR86_003711 [Recurvomyces mirabilis]